jgi:small-conductance mechanosensitive channel
MVAATVLGVIIVRGMDRLTTWFDPHSPLWSLVGVAVALTAALVIYRLIVSGVTRWSQRTGTPVDDVALRQLRGPLFWLLPVATLGLALPLLKWAEESLGPVRQAHTVLVILLVAWLAIRVTKVIEVVVRHRFDATVSDNLQARAVHTQVRAFRNIVSFVIGLLAVAFVLMTFDRIRQLGVGLLASAGVAGMAIGFAAQRSVAAVIAGIQVALTQPIRVDDVVIMEGEWGRVEEITLTYVVIRTWDLRRLLVPMTNILERPFQNWTRSSAKLLGTVDLYVDYDTPVSELRQELERILKDQPELWDGETWGLQVTETSERGVKLRALMSAADSGKLWDLRCQVREQLVAFVSERFPQCLPRLRAEIEPLDKAA